MLEADIPLLLPNYLYGVLSKTAENLKQDFVSLLFVEDDRLTGSDGGKFCFISGCKTKMPRILRRVFDHLLIFTFLKTKPSRFRFLFQAGHFLQVYI